MNNTLLILKQEYLKRVKKKSFILLTILMPFLIAGVYGLVIYFSVKDDTEQRTIAVYDETSLFMGEFSDEGATTYHFIPKEEYEKLKTNLKGSGYYGLLHIPANIYSTNQAQLISEKQLPIELAERIERKLSRFIEIDGSKVWDYYKEGKIDEIEQYNRQDVEQARLIYKKLNFIKG